MQLPIHSCTLRVITGLSYLKPWWFYRKIFEFFIEKKNGFHRILQTSKKLTFSRHYSTYLVFLDRVKFLLIMRSSTFYCCCSISENHYLLQGVPVEKIQNVYTWKRAFLPLYWLKCVWQSVSFFKISNVHMKMLNNFSKIGKIFYLLLTFWLYQHTVMDKSCSWL